MYLKERIKTKSKKWKQTGQHSRRHLKLLIFSLGCCKRVGARVCVSGCSATGFGERSVRLIKPGRQGGGDGQGEYKRK